MTTTVVFHDIPRFNLGLHLTPYLKNCDQKIFHGKFLYLSLRFEYYFTTQFCGVRCDHNSRYAAFPDLVTTDIVWQRSLIWECSRAKLNLGGMPESLRKWKSENCDRWCERVSCGDFCTVFLGF